MVLKNIMEEVVWSVIDQIVPTCECCKCERCRMDIASYALNRLPPRYVVTMEGELLSKFTSTNGQDGLDVTTAVVQAITIVKENPKH